MSFTNKVGRRLRRGLLLTSLSSLIAVFTFGVFAAETTDEAEPPTIEVESGNPKSGDAAAIENGEKLYVRWCQQCHGAKLDGYSPRWGKHGADLRKFWQGYEKFVTIVQDGIPEKMMPPHSEYISEDEILQIGSFIETKAIEGAIWK